MQDLSLSSSMAQFSTPPPQVLIPMVPFFATLTGKLPLCIKIELYEKDLQTKAWGRMRRSPHPAQLPIFNKALILWRIVRPN
jgi:hypothetical protein